MKEQEVHETNFSTLTESSPQSSFIDSDTLVQQNQMTASTKALLYKSFKIQQRNYCSNICQIVTPLLCIAFTLLADTLSGDIVSNKIQSFEFPQPLDLPYFYTLAAPLNLSCSQHYVLQTEENQKASVKRLLSRTMSYYCQKTQSLMPIYDFQDQGVNSYLFNQLKIADKEAFQRGEDLKTDLPDGLVKFKAVSDKKLDVVFGINDLRLPEYHRNNGVTKIKIKTEETQQLMSYLRVTEGLMMVMEKFNRAFLQLSNPKEIIMGSFMYMPFDGQDKSLKNKIINILGAGLYPLGLSLLLPIFLYAIVSEKEEKLIEIMKMNGLNVKYYWLSTFIFNFCIICVMLCLFYGFGRFYLGLTLFVETGYGVFWALLIGWAIALISMTNFVQIFLNNAKSATIVGYLLSIFSCFVGQAICTFIYAYPQRVPIYILIYPPFALCRAIYLIGFNCASNSSCYKDLYQTQQQYQIILIILYSWFLVYILSIWLNQMIQQDYGVSKYPQFIQNCLNFLKPSSKKQSNETLIEQNIYDQTQGALEEAQVEMSNENMVENLIDQSVREHSSVVQKYPLNSKPLIIRKLSKKYQQQSSSNKDYIALKPLTLSLEKKQIFGLLGPNGAGKTTLISVLTGMYPQSMGNAYIDGKQIGSAATNKHIGVCPQFDLLWSDLSVYEHLKFYSILKMVKTEKIEQEITQLLRDVDLLQWKNTASKRLSGGMQRRLSLAIALVGNPKVIFLDQPSSGLDPSHRRQMWDILLKCKKRTSIFLTTHLMQEAEVLCDRVGIISKGQLHCIGETNQLKEKFGKGYRLTISYSGLLKTIVQRKKSRSFFGQVSSTNEERMSRQVQLSKQPSIQSQVQQQQQSSELRPGIINEIIHTYQGQIVNQLNTRIILKIEKKHILNCINQLKNEKDLNWLVSQPNLYDVFIHFIK